MARVCHTREIPFVEVSIMKSFWSVALVAIGVGILSSPALAGVVVVQQTAAAPTYTTTLNFDEPGGPTGANVPNNSWSGAPWNIPVFSSGDGVANFVGDNSAATGQGTNSYYGPFGVFITFGSQDLTSMSFQGWDNGGPGGPFGGGALVDVLNNGIEIGSLFVTPAWGGVGKTWYNITTTGTTVFDEVRFLGFDFAFPQSVVDNLSWNTTPEPASLTLFGFGAIALITRRRRHC